MAEKQELSPVEGIKVASQRLRGSLKEELTTDAAAFAKDSTNLLKFHGMYQQDDRDARKGAPGEKHHSLMIRGRIPGGRLNSKQYLVWDDLATKFGNGSMRLTTRQSIQLHGILKKNIKQTIQEIRKSLLSTEGACGDVVRNVTQAVNPLGLPELSLLTPVAQQLSDHFKARSNAYAEVWLDGEEVDPIKENEPIYGISYLPRKFKVAVTLAGNNTVDLYTNDLAFAATVADNRIDGFFVFVGGGLGKTHRNEKTYPRLASNLGWFPSEKLIPVAEAIVSIHRDFGDRKDRKHARLKYVVEERGVDWVRSTAEMRSGTLFQQKILPKWKVPNYLGWHKRVDGKYSFGLHILSGRIKDTPQSALKSALREIAEKFEITFQITADQDLILTNIWESDRPLIDALFTYKKVQVAPATSLYSRALSCPALPTCGLAIAEAERYLPDLLPLIQTTLEKHSLQSRPPIVRMTGCPNGCARPYNAELALVGRSMNIYALYVGGNEEGDRLAREISDSVSTKDLPLVLDKLFSLWKSKGAYEENFGDFCSRMSVEELQTAIPVKA